MPTMSLGTAAVFGVALGVGFAVGAKLTEIAVEVMVKQVKGQGCQTPNQNPS